MTSKITKDDLRAPDTFHSVSDMLFQWIEKNAKPIAGVIGLALLVGIGWITYGFVATRAETAASEALYGPLDEVKKAELKMHDEKAPVDYANGLAPAIAKLEEAIKKHSGTRVSLVTAMEAAVVLFQQKRFDEARVILNLSGYRPSSGDVMSGLFRLHKGLAELESKKVDEAIATFKSILDTSGLKEFHAEALLKLGICFEQKGDLTQAREAYAKASRQFPDSEAAASALQYSRLLDLQSPKGT